MSTTTIEGISDQGQIRLKSDVRLPDRTKVYVVIPDFQIEQAAHVFSPRLSHPEQAVDFKMEVVDGYSENRHEISPLL